MKNLQLKWIWAMNDSGSNQTTPIVHNGIIYLASPSNIVQALDGSTGDLIWETRVGPDQAPGYGGIRSIAIAEDKVFLPTSDAHMVAIDARNGKILWDTPASCARRDRARYQNPTERAGAARLCPAVVLCSECVL